MQVLAENVLVLLIFSFIGWLLGSRRLLSTQNLRILSVLEVWVFLPCNSLNSFSKNFTMEYVSEKYMLILISTCIILALILLNYLLVPKLVSGKYRQNVIKYTLTVPNFGYVGYPLVQSVYGDLMLLNAQVFAVPMTVYLSTEGYRSLTNADSVSLKKIISPSLVGMMIGAVFGLTELELPAVAAKIASSGSSCMGPVSMLLAGITISDYNIKDLLKNKTAYFVVFFRLLLIPIALCLILHPFVSREILMITVLLYSMPCGLNTIVFPKMIGEDCRLGASMAMISTVACLITIPLCMHILELVCGGI